MQRKFSLIVAWQDPRLGMVGLINCETGEEISLKNVTGMTFWYKPGGTEDDSAA